MITIAKLSIIDTGYLRPTNTGTQLSSSFRALPSNWGDSGQIITLEGVNFNPNIRANVDENTEIDAEDFSILDYASYDNIKFTINGVLDRTSTTEMHKVMLLVDLCRTKGYKILFYDSTGTDANYELIKWLSYKNNSGTYTAHTFTSGEQTAFGVTGAVPHIHVRFTQCTMTQDASSNNLIRFSLVGTVDKMETSTI